MKKSNVYHLFVVIFLLIVVISCSIRRGEPIRGAMNITDSRIKNGEEKFMMYCQKCHPGGEGGLGPALNTNPAPRFIKRFQVRHGLGVMPSFKKEEISDQDVKDIAKYMKALKHH